MAKLATNGSLAFCMVGLALLCGSALAQEDSAEDWYQIGQELARNGSFSDAAEAYGKAINLSPENLDARLNKAMALHQAGELDESILARDDAVRAAIRYLGDLNRSVRVLNREVEPVTSRSASDLAEAWDLRGILLADLAGPLGNNRVMYEESLKFIETAIKLDPQRAEFWMDEGAVLDTRLNRTAEALAAYDKAIEIGEEDGANVRSLSDAWIGKGSALARLGRYDESIQSFDKAMDLNPENTPYILFSKGDALNKSGKYEEASQAYDKVIELSATADIMLTAQAYDRKGDALFAEGRHSEAAKAYDLAIEQYPSESMSAQTWYKKYLALKKLGRSSESGAALDKAKELGYEG